MPFGFINPEDLPPELAEFFQHAAHQQDMHQMSHQDWIHQVQEYLTKQDKDDLLVLRRIIVMCNGELSAHFAGLISAILLTKHDVCMCGQSHGTEQDILAPSSEPVVRDPAQPDRSRQSLMDEYELVERGVPTFENPEAKILVCGNCGTQVASLEDRMLRPPGVKGCEGCQNKAKWG